MKNNMTFNKKYKLWSLIIGMICMPAEQVRADFFHDEQGMFTNEGYIFTASAAVALVAASYATYRYLYPFNIQATENESQVKNKTTNSASLISMALAIEVMAIMALEGGVEEYIRQPIREKHKVDALLQKELLDRAYKKKIADALLEQELLKTENTLEWKNRKNIGCFDILNEQQRNELLDIKLRQIKKLDSINIPIIARLTKNYSYERLIKFIEDSGTLAINENDGILDISHINKIFNDSNVGLLLEKQHVFSHADTVETAYHEAGHAIVILESDKCILHEVTIEPRRDEKSRYLNPYQLQRPLPFHNFYEIHCIVGFCRQVPISENDDNLSTWTEDDLQKELMVSLAGGVSEQVADLPCQLKQKDYDQGSLQDFLSRSRASKDITQARLIALHMVRLKYVKEGIEYWPEQSKIDRDKDKIITETYNKTYKFIKENKEDVKKVAMLLMAKKTVRGDEVYELVGKRRPKYDFEEENIHNKE